MAGSTVTTTYSQKPCQHEQDEGIVAEAAASCAELTP